MKVIRDEEVAEQDATDAPIFFGGRVSRRPIVVGDVSEDLRVNLVTFAAGARNKLHTHTRDQVLIVTNGRGIVATEDEEVEVTEGNTIIIPRGERHWHGAAPDAEFAHLTVMLPDSVTEMFD